jgi:FKBP-type peptidyl-prolyl cis-trans isomerase 2
MAFKEKDFVEMEYTAMTKIEKLVFDTTSEEVAKKKDLFNPDYKYGSVIICLGEKQVLPGLEKQIIGKEPGNYTISLGVDEAFGRKSAKLLKLIPMSAFKKDSLAPVPGLQVNIDGLSGVIRSASSGRVIVDFNHPLSGKEVVYEINLIKKISEPSEKAKSVMKVEFNIVPEIELNGTKLTVKHEFPAEIIAAIKERVLFLVPEIKEMEFVKAAPKADKKAETRDLSSAKGTE